MMDREILGGLVNSISRFIHLVACQSSKTIQALKDLRHMVSILKLLKPVLDEVCDSQISSSDQLLELFEDLDMLVNQARESLEKQPNRASKLCNAFQIGALIMKVQESSLKLCYFLQELLRSSPSTLIYTCVQQSIQEIQCADQGMTFALIENALRDLKEPGQELLMRIADSIGLTSNHELLVEWISLEKERGKAENMSEEEAGFIYQIVDLFHQIRNCLDKLDQFSLKSGVSVPPYFRCHLSLEMMVEPVILASGQTYERFFIEKWLDSGLTFCPKTRQNLPHTSLVPNDIVKALITSWCKENGIRPCHSVESRNILFLCSCSSGSEDTCDGSSFLDSINKDSNSRHCYEFRNGSQLTAAMPCCNGEKDGLVTGHCPSIVRETPDFKSLLEQELCSHSWSDSISSINSTTELLGRSRNRTNSWECASFPSSKDLVISPWLSSDSSRYSKRGDVKEHEDRQLSCVGLGSDGVDAVDIQKLVDDLNCPSNEVQAAAALELRMLAKDSRENRILIVRCGAITPLVSLLYSKAKRVQENAVTALLNLSINDNNNKIAMVERGVIDPFIHVLKHGSEEAKENTAAALFSLSTMEEFRIRIGRSGAIRPLVDLLGYGSLRGKKDATAALFNLSIFHENKARIVRAGAVKYLVELLDPEMGMVDKSVALLANLSTVAEGCSAISQEGGISLLVEVVDSGSQRGKENAASALLQLCLHSQKLGSMVLQEGAIPPLIALSQQGTPRAKEKAQQILSHFRSLRERAPGKSMS